MLYKKFCRSIFILIMDFKLFLDELYLFVYKLKVVSDSSGPQHFRKPICCLLKYSYFYISINYFSNRLLRPRRLFNIWQGSIKGTRTGVR